MSDRATVNDEDWVDEAADYIRYRTDRMILQRINKGTSLAAIIDAIHIELDWAMGCECGNAGRLYREHGEDCTIVRDTRAAYERLVQKDREQKPRT